MSHFIMDEDPESLPWTVSQVLRATRNSLIWNGISLSLLLALVWLTGDYLFYFFRGPAVVNDRQLLNAIERNGQRSLIEYIELRDRTLLPTNWREVTTRDGRPYSDVPYFLLPVGDRSKMLVMARSQLDGKHLVGPISGTRELDQRVINAILSEHPEYAGQILPVVLSNVAVFNVPGYLLLGLLIPWGTYCLWNVVRAVMARVNPASHPIETQLAKLGDASALAANLNDEMRSGPVEQIGKASLTPSWILRPTVFSARCVRLEDVVWAYQVNQTTETFLILCQRNGKTTTLLLKPQQAQAAIVSMTRRAPWVLTGYDAHRWKQWQKNREAIIAQSDARRSI